jgi:mannuronan 5-epimerase
MKEIPKPLGYGIAMSFFNLVLATSNAQDTDPHCINYDPSDRLIKITCKTANLIDIDNQLNDTDILEKQSDPTDNNNSEVWFLNAHLEVAEGAEFTIDSGSTKWLKIHSAEETAYHIDVFGSMKVDSVMISSWNPEEETFDEFVESDPHPRPSIRIDKDATGTTDITNSELAYLGGGAGKSHGLSYYGGNGSIIRGNNIHHLEMGFYSEHVKYMLIENNDIHHNIKYGLDPHSGTHDMLIRKNVVHDNGFIGIICSQHCRNITIEGNEVYNNEGTNIALSIDMQNSVVRNNYIHEEEPGHIGIAVATASNNNKIYDNIISNTNTGVGVGGGSSSNYIGNNILLGVEGLSLHAKDYDAVNNIFENNLVFPSDRADRTVGHLYKNTGTIFRNNDIGSGGEYAEYRIGRNSTLNLENSKLSSELKIRSDGSTNTLKVSNSGIINVTDDDTTRTYNTDITPFSAKISSREIFISPLSNISTSTEPIR